MTTNQMRLRLAEIHDELAELNPAANADDPAALALNCALIEEMREIENTLNATHATQEQSLTDAIYTWAQIYSHD